MRNIFYKPRDGWVGDLIPFGHGGKFYLYYLHDERKGETEDDYGFGTTWNLLITTDGTDIEDKGVVLPTGGAGDIDRSCYTGNVLQAEDGKFHMFYTAQNHHNPKYCRNGKSIQYVMHATSDNLLNWEKCYESAFGADESIYEVFDWRDPFVYYSEVDGCYNMLLAARKQGAPQKNGGCIALCQSKDLWNWEVKEPFYAPNSYLTHECPDLFKMGDWWYLVYSTFSERFITHYRMSRSPNGPWIASPEDSFDGRGFYAAKTAEQNDERWAFAWVPSKRGDKDSGQWDWGGSLVMHKLRALSDGKLKAGISPGIRAAFKKEICLPKTENKIYQLNAKDHLAIEKFSDLPNQFMLEADISFSSGIRYFGLGIRQDDSCSNGYFFRLEPFYNRIVFDMWPRRTAGVNQWYIDGDKSFVVELERPYMMNNVRSVQLRLLADGDICTLYVDDAVALTTRTYNLSENNWSFFAFDGTVDVSNVKLFIIQE